MESIGCTLSVEPIVNSGTTFTLKIPADLVTTRGGDANTLADDDIGEEDARLLTGARVLLVEDHETTRKAASRLLESKGAIVIQARTGKEAVHMLLHEQPRVLLLDLMLPDADGTEILRFVTANRPPSLRCVLAVSGDVRDARLAEVRELGADDLIPKPLDIQRLVEAICSRLRANSAAHGHSTHAPDGQSADDSLSCDSL